MSDAVHRFLLRDAAVRGEIVTLDTAWREVVSRHDLPAPVRDRLGELSAAALLLSATLKFDGTLVLQIHGDGPVSLFVVEAAPDGGYRATAKLRDGSVIGDATRLTELVNAHGRGRFVVTLDPRSASRNRQTYQGIVPFEGGSVAAALEQYMARSEQLPTRLWLAADERRAVGLLLQRLPLDGGYAIADDGLAAETSSAVGLSSAIGAVSTIEASSAIAASASDASRSATPTAPMTAAPTAVPLDADGWNRLQHLADTVTSTELLTLPPERLLTRLFWQEPLHAFDRRDCRFACRCTRDKVADMLRLLGRDEVDGIVAELGHVEVRCEFCNQPYAFDAVDCAGLFVPEPMTGSAIRH
ncbi:MAG: Hsp33 family molecular chaperone HslO [Burkholderiaceae bacterium]